jgi:hypothetical protein
MILMGEEMNKEQIELAKILSKWGPGLIKVWVWDPSDKEINKMLSQKTELFCIEDDYDIRTSSQEDRLIEEEYGYYV